MRAPSPLPDVAVVGAGHNGLTCAALLAQEGLDVVVLERRGAAGGAAATEELVPGYRFSTCAYSLHLLHEEVVRRLELDLPELLELPPRVAVLPDGSRVRDGDVEPEAFERWERLWDDAARAVDPHLIGPPPRVDELALPFAPEATSDKLLREIFGTDEARAVYAPRYADFAADAPGGPAAYAYVETGRCRPKELQGVPRGGMGAIGDAFVRTAERAGARIVLGAEAARIGGGVVLRDGTRIEARAVVSAADPLRTAALLGDPPPDVDLRPSGAKLHCALRGRPDVESGLVHLYPRLDWYAHAYPDVAEASLVELQVPTLVDETLAPRGGHCLSAYLPLAPFRRADELRALLLDRIRVAVPNVDDVLVDCVLHAPEQMAQRVGLTNIHHVPHAPGQMYDARGDGTTARDGVFLCGAGIHPGGEVSGVPGLNAARLVAEYLS